MEPPAAPPSWLFAALWRLLSPLFCQTSWLLTSKSARTWQTFVKTRPLTLFVYLAGIWALCIDKLCPQGSWEPPSTAAPRPHLQVHQGGSLSIHLKSSLPLPCDLRHTFPPGPESSCRHCQSADTPWIREAGGPVRTQDLWCGAEGEEEREGRQEQPPLAHQHP